jgi:hypothetical protein
MPNINRSAASIVLAAHHFNPSIASQVWLLRNEVFGESDLQKGCVFTDAFVNVNTKQFNLLISPEQVQVALRNQTADASAAVNAISRISSSLPHTPFTGVGLNFLWHVLPETEAVDDTSRALFFDKDSPLDKEFDTPDARFGKYLSKAWEDSRLKLDIKPLTVGLKEPAGARAEIVQFGFNFHRDLQSTEEISEKAKLIETHLSLWERANEESRRIVESALGRLTNAETT